MDTSNSLVVVVDNYGYWIVVTHGKEYDFVSRHWGDTYMLIGDMVWAIQLVEGVNEPYEFEVLHREEFVVGAIGIPNPFNYKWKNKEEENEHYTQQAVEFAGPVMKLIDQYNQANPSFSWN